MGMTECQAPNMAVTAMDSKTNGFIFVSVVVVEAEEKDVEFSTKSSSW